ncbi:MAG: 5-formyltetrahydrofolate cyclo-ligase [Sandarakinorhabdus sp.]|nr:5-formyltetrahydrofolate cyclo-ligase [Sandarakinorhabdus sp.]
MTKCSKQALRRHYRAARQAFAASLSLAERDTLERALAAIVMPLLTACQRPASYVAMPEEISPRFIAATVLPRVTGGALTFHDGTGPALIPGFAGIREPRADAPRVTPDLLLVPLVAITPAGVRLGQGKGYYDRFLAAHPVRTIALAWDVQIAGTLPTDPWDIAMDYIATPTRLFDCANPR